jgi:dihydropyrimidinase
MYFAEHLGAQIYIPHISTRMALDEVRKWRTRYDKVFVETCPHYLTHTEDSDLLGMGKANPPFRSADDVAAMWEGLQDGTIDVVASDHCPRKQCYQRKTSVAGFARFSRHRHHLAGAVARGLSQRPTQSAPHCRSVNQGPCRHLQCGANKGSLAIGSDADITLVDLNLSRVVNPAELGSYSDYSLYEGQNFKGWPVETIVRGQHRHGQRQDLGSARLWQLHLPLTE